jgi:predicted amidohydrolase YtcJ
MTSSAAYAGFAEQEVGILTVGRRADFTVLSADPTRVALERLRQLKALRTVVGGRTTYRRR